MNKTEKEVERLNKKYGTHYEVIPPEEITIKNNYDIEKAKFKWEKKITTYKFIFAGVCFVIIWLVYLSGMMIIVSL